MLSRLPQATEVVWGEGKDFKKQRSFKLQVGGRLFVELSELLFTSVLSSTPFFVL